MHVLRASEVRKWLNSNTSFPFGESGKPFVIRHRTHMYEIHSHYKAIKVLTVIEQRQWHTRRLAGHRSQQKGPCININAYILIQNHNLTVVESLHILRVCVRSFVTLEEATHLILYFPTRRLWDKREISWSWNCIGALYILNYLGDISLSVKHSAIETLISDSSRVPESTAATSSSLKHFQNSGGIIKLRDLDLEQQQEEIIFYQL